MCKPLQNISKDITEIYNRNVDTVYKVCFMFLKNKADAEDALQATFVKLIQCNKILQSYDHEKAWLIVTAQNQCKNMLRHWWRKKQIHMETIDEQYISSVDHNCEILEQVLNLPKKYKMPIYLFYYEGYKTKEIAQILKIKESTIRSQLHTGRKLLKISIGGDSCD